MSQYACMSGERRIAVQSMLRRCWICGVSKGFIWERDIEAYETDKEKIEICKERLNAVLREYDIDGVRWNIHNRDYLKAQMKKYSYVIGNPPYITITNKIQKESVPKLL